MERCKESSRLYEGKILNLRVDQVQFEDGTSTIREVIEHRGAAAIVPILEGDKVVLVRQFRYAANSELLEIPAGTLELGEAPEICAMRELEEETGYKSQEMLRIMECHIAPGYSTERIHFFLARALVRTEMKTDEDKRIKIEVIPIREALVRIRDGEIRDAKTVCGLYRALELL